MSIQIETEKRHSYVMFVIGFVVLVVVGVTWLFSDWLRLKENENIVPSQPTVEIEATPTASLAEEYVPPVPTSLSQAEECKTNPHELCVSVTPIENLEKYPTYVSLPNYEPNEVVDVFFHGYNGGTIWQEAVIVFLGGPSVYVDCEWPGEPDKITVEYAKCWWLTTYPDHSESEITFVGLDLFEVTYGDSLLLIHISNMNDEISMGALSKDVVGLNPEE